MSVFGALNRFISRLDSDQGSNQGRLGNQGEHGFQVLKNNNDLEGFPLEPWFDFIVGINGRRIDQPDVRLFAKEVANCGGASVNFTIWTAKGQFLREEHVAVPRIPQLLGLTLQWTLLGSTAHVWHILDVIADSPADRGGLLPYSDYVLGSPDGVIRGESGLGELVEHFMNRPLDLYVYNQEYNVTRIVTITPSRGWGGEGALGCVLGYGHLHQIPPALEEPPAAPGDTLFEVAPTNLGMDAAPKYLPKIEPPGASDQLLRPADLPMPQNTAETPGKTRPARHALRGGSGFDEIFAEGLAQSRERGQTPKPSKNVLPPPPVMERRQSSDSRDQPVTTTLVVPATPLEESRQTRSPGPSFDDDDEDT